MRLSSAEIRLAEVLLLAGQLLLDRTGIEADPYMTLVGYFNATRELAGMRRSSMTTSARGSATRGAAPDSRGDMVPRSETSTWRS